jgi:hypothetical protein
LNECLDNIVRSSHDLNGEINQIFFVVKEGESRSNKILEIYKILKLVFGDQKPIDEYITIVFTNTNTNILENPEGCLENYRKIMKKNEKECEEVNRILNSCNKVVYIDNPPVPQSNDGAKKEAVEKDRETSKSRLVKILKEEQERSYSKG